MAAKWEYICRHRSRYRGSLHADKAHAGQGSKNHNDTLQNVKNVERTIDSYMVQMN